MPNSFNMFGPHKKMKRKKNLVEFKAGKMKLEQNNWVYPDKRKGLVYIHRTSDGMMHFCWKDRTADKVEDDLIVFPMETIFKRLPECTTGRAYLLKIKESKKLFFWMQEPKEEKDAGLCNTVNDILNQRQTETMANGSKDLNIVEFTNLLGQLNDIGALNEIDLIEILAELAQGIETHATAESDISNVYGMNTNPFQIGSNISAPTYAERISDTEEPPNNQKKSPDYQNALQQSSVLNISSIYSQNTIDMVDPNLVFTETTLTQLSQNQVFKSKVLSINDSEGSPEVDIGSEEFKTCIRNFGIILSDRSTGPQLLHEMGIPENVINKARENDIVSLLNDLEDFYNGKNDDTN